MTRMDEIIEVKGLKKQFGEVKAVDDLSFSVEKGELFGFLGVNGAGKSTTINMLCTLLAPTAGHAKLCGYELGAEDESVRKQIGVVWQHNCLDDRLSVKENLYVRGSLYGFRAQELRGRVDHVCEALHLEDIFTAAYKRLSGGQKRRCEIAAALINTPEILFLDEPTTGLDPQTRQFVWESIRTLQEENKMTVFLTTHYMEEAANARHIAIIDHGRILEYGTPFALKERYAKDRLHLIPRDGCEAELMQMLSRAQSNVGEQMPSGAQSNAGEQMPSGAQSDVGEQMSSGAQSDVGEQMPSGAQSNAAASMKDGMPQQVALGITRADGRLILSVKDSMEALEILNTVHPCLCGFEMIQGTLDDVFLNVTGKSLEQ